MCPNSRLVPAKYSTKWPHEHFVQILQIFLVRLIWIIKGVEWWWWFEKWCWFAKFQKGDDLHFVSKSPLVTLILVNVCRVNPGGQHKKWSPWLSLGWGGKSWQGLVWDLLNRRAQSGWHYFGPKFPLSYVMEIWIFLCFEKCFFDSKMFVIDLLRFPKHWHKPTWSWLRICKVGQMCMWVRFAIFPISFISLLLRF